MAMELMEAAWLSARGEVAKEPRKGRPRELLRSLSVREARERSVAREVQSTKAHAGRRV